MIVTKKANIELFNGLRTNDFDCRCDQCTCTIIHEKLLEALHNLMLKVPGLTINSAYRCPFHNQLIRGAQLSRHMSGEAVDLSLHGVKDYTPSDIEKFSKDAGFSYFKSYKEENFVHCDTRLPMWNNDVMFDNNFKFINIKFGRQYGDNFLFNINCPSCGDMNLQGFPFSSCASCGHDMGTYMAFLDENFCFKVVHGTRRKAFFGKKTVRKLIDIQQDKCAYCDCDLNYNFEIEHIKPLACGGTNEFSNICLSCKECNQIAGAKWFDCFYAKREYIRGVIKSKTGAIV